MCGICHINLQESIILTNLRLTNLRLTNLRLTNLRLTNPSLTKPILTSSSRETFYDPNEIQIDKSKDRKFVTSTNPCPATNPSIHAKDTENELEEFVCK